MMEGTLKQVKNPDVPLEPGTKTFKDGDLCIIVSPPYATDGYHLSFSLPNKRPSPTLIYAALSTLAKKGIIPNITGWDFEPGTINRNVMHLREKLEYRL